MAPEWGVAGDCVVNRRVLRILILAGLLGVVPLVSGCTKAPAGPSTFADYSQTDLRVGTGPGAVANNVLTLRYTAWFYDPSSTDGKGALFESSAGGAPFQFVLGVGQVITGWERGLVGMQAGGLRRLVIPPSLAYGPTRNRVVPPNTTLVFEIELLKIGTTVTP